MNALDTIRQRAAQPGNARAKESLEVLEQLDPTKDRGLIEEITRINMQGLRYSNEDQDILSKARARIRNRL